MERRKRYIAAQARIFKALGHPSRLLMVDALREGEKCVCELQALVGDDMSTISKHLAVLREAGVVSAEKRGDQHLLPSDSVLSGHFFAVHRRTGGTARALSDGNAGPGVIFFRLIIGLFAKKDK